MSTNVAYDCTSAAQVSSRLSRESGASSAAGELCSMRTIKAIITKQLVQLLVVPWPVCRLWPSWWSIITSCTKTDRYTCTITLITWLINTLIHYLAVQPQLALYKVHRYSPDQDVNADIVVWLANILTNLRVAIVLIIFIHHTLVEKTE